MSKNNPKGLSPKGLSAETLLTSFMMMHVSWHNPEFKRHLVDITCTPDLQTITFHLDLKDLPPNYNIAEELQRGMDKQWPKWKLLSVAGVNNHMKIMFRKNTDRR